VYDHQLIPEIDDADPSETRFSITSVSLPIRSFYTSNHDERNFGVLSEKFHLSRSAFEGHSRSLGTDTDRLATCNFLLAMGCLIPFPRQTAISVESRKFSPSRAFNALHWGSSPWKFVTATAPKN